jgi:hypothetical protein
VDLSLSPDLEAFWCYLILASLAVLVAVIQVRTLLKGYTNAWSSARAWLLVAAYSAVPISLFWLLDRADALHDTSVFGAVLVAITYRQILSGTTQGIAVPGGLSKAWQPFVTWSDSVAAAIRDRIARNNSRYDAKAIDKLATSPVFDEVHKIVLDRASDPAQAQLALDAYDKLKPPLDDSGVKRKKAAYLYLALKALPDVDADRLLKDKGAISKTDYYLYAREGRSSIFVGLSAIAAIVIALLLAANMSKPEYRARYYLWRFEKPNGTSMDRFRAEQHLDAGLRSGNKDFIGIVRAELTRRLKFEGLPLETADRMLQLLFQKTDADDRSLIEALSDSIRTRNADVRARTQKALLYLADESAILVPDALRKWAPAKEDSATCIDSAANVWNHLLKAPPVATMNGMAACFVETRPAK